MRQVLLNSLPMHEPEKVCPPAFFIAYSRELLCSQATAELRSAWTGEGARPHTGGSLQRKSAFPVMIQAVHQRNIEESTA